jgi:hypothetical protein
MASVRSDTDESSHDTASQDSLGASESPRTPTSDGVYASNQFCAFWCCEAHKGNFIAKKGDLVEVLHDEDLGENRALTKMSTTDESLLAVLRDLYVAGGTALIPIVDSTKGKAQHYGFIFPDQTFPARKTLPLEAICQGGGDCKEVSDLEFCPCLGARYCSKTCQANAWEEHQKECHARPLACSTHPLLGPIEELIAKMYSCECDKDMCPANLTCRKFGKIHPKLVDQFHADGDEVCAKKLETLQG